MAIPAGAYADLAQGVTEDAAARAAAEAYIAALETAYPGETVSASREYLCRAPRDAWPAAGTRGA